MTMTPQGGYEPVLMVIGDISVSQHQVYTPNGAFPLAGTNWMVQDNSMTTRVIPTWAIVVTIIGFFFIFLFSLLFLLAKENRVQGFVQVTVQGPGLYHATQVPALGPQTAFDLNHRVNYVRQLVAALPRPGQA